MFVVPVTNISYLGGGYGGGGYGGGFGMYPGVRIRELHLLILILGGDRMGNLGQGLQNIDWQNQSLAKFEKK